MKPAFSAPAMLDTWCFKQHHKHLSPRCRKAYDQYHHSKGPLLQPDATVNPVERVCGEDRMKYCPEVTVPYTAHDLFDRECFLISVRHLSPDCRHMMLEHLHKHSVCELPSFSFFLLLLQRPDNLSIPFSFESGSQTDLYSSPSDPCLHLGDLMPDHIELPRLLLVLPEEVKQREEE